MENRYGTLASWVYDLDKPVGRSFGDIEFYRERLSDCRGTILEPAVGNEIRKTRPAVIVSNDAANRHLSRVVVAPLTSNTGKQYPGEALVTIDGQNNKAMADQIMAADKSRLKSRLGQLSKSDLRAAEDAILLHLGLPR